MYLKTRTWFLVSLVCFLGAAYFWRLGNERAARDQKPKPATNTNGSFALLSTSSAPDRLTGGLPAPDPAKPAVQTNTNAPFPYRISNTPRKIEELIRSDSAVLLRNALIDSALGAPLDIPAHLRSQGDPGSYIVQARGTITEAFRDQLKFAGAEVVSYVPNNAYLVKASAAAAAQLRASPLTQFVTPWEPYFKLAPKLLQLAVEQKALPDGNPLSVLVFPGEAEAAEQQLRALGATVMGKERSPFGTQMLLHAPADQLVSVAQLTAVQAVEPAYRRALANDLARTRVRVSTNTITPNNHLDLRGTGIRVGVNDTGVYADHPDLSPRVFLDAPATGIDTISHGTHVAGIIASSGANGPNGDVVSGSTNGANFRGMAPEAQIYAQPIDLISGPLKPDAELQETAATNGVFISNNSWTYFGAFDYTFASAQWDAAVRDSVPGGQGSQAITYVFAAGNEGLGDDDGGGGFENTIGAPATAKNVITVGATEQIRNITNEVVLNNQTNTPFARMTDSDSEVASFSSRGNVGAGVEGPFGRFKPDVVAPGVFVVSTRTTNWVNNLLVSVSAGYLRNQIVPVGDTNIYFFFGGPNAIQARILVIPNNRSPIPFPTNSIYVRQSTPPPPSDFQIVSNGLTFSPVADDIYYFGIGNNFNQDLHCDIQVIVLSTNPPTPGDVQLVSLNQDLEPHYRYESGTSMAAPVVSGVLALMQQHLQARNVTNPSPALMKALLINGARSIGTYDLEVNKFGNFQGWGMVNLTNSVPLHSPGDVTQWPVRFFDQATNGLETGQSHTRIVTLASNTPAMRISLVWTDPPGNPSVGSKLVNDLDLIVTNLSTIGQAGGPEVFVGNVISGDFSVSVGTNYATDVVNNVENVYIRAPRAGQYSVTVVGRRINVNAVTAFSPNGIAQDYALAISAGNPGEAPVFTVSPTPASSRDTTPLVTVISNSIPVFDQRIGANPNIVPGSTNGSVTQWRFFQFEGGGGTNTNVAFFTFLTPNLSRPRTSQEADIDLYVSTDSSLTNLNQAAIGAAWTSKNAGGTEAVALTNQTTLTTYYIGVKSEDQQAAIFGLFGFAGSTPFSQRDADGNVIVNGLALPLEIPDGSSEEASGALVFAYCLEPIEIRNVIVTNMLTHENGGDLIGILAHSGRQSVLNNHRAFEGTVELIYDDSDSGVILDSTPTDPPGTLRNFWGQEGQGFWQMVMIDDSLIATGRVETFTIVLQPQRQTNDEFIAVTILPNRWYYTFVDVPADASKLKIEALPDNGIVEVYARRNLVPDRNNFDHRATFGAPTGGTLEITPADSPPLSAGTYFIGLFNPNSTVLTVNLRITVERNLLGGITNQFRGTGTNLLDDALTTFLLTVTNSQQIFDTRVGVRIDHQRASDLVLTLVSPAGTRVLLAENRGGANILGYGGTAQQPTGGPTNLVYTIFTDSTNLTLTPIKFAQGPFTNQFCSNAVVASGPQVMFDGFEAAACSAANGVGSMLSGWLVESNDVDVLCPLAGFYGLPHSGTKALDLNGYYPGLISRLVNTTSGQLYVLRNAYCRNPFTTFPDFVATCNVLIDDQVADRLSYGNFNSTNQGNLNWFINEVGFMATSNMTKIQFASTTDRIVSCGTPCGGMYLDSVQINQASVVARGCNYVFPEEPLRQLQGENAFGTWRLEVLDNRVGAPLNARLLSWQLDFDFVNTNPPVTLLTNGQCLAGIVTSNQVARFAVRVPFVARFATNLLTSANNTVLSAHGSQPAVGSVPPDQIETFGGISHQLDMDTVNPPALRPGLTYYLAVRNDSPTTVSNTFTLCVYFDADDTNDLSTVRAITNGQCITSAILASNLLHYYQFDADSNAVELSFELINLSENADMVISRGLPLPNPTTFYARSAQPGTTDEFIGLTNYNTGLGGRWYIGIYNRTNSTVQYTLCVREVVGVRYANVDCTNTAIINPGSVHYYQHTVSPIALRTHFTVSNIMNGEVNMYITPFPPMPPPSSANFVIAGTNPGPAPELAALSLASMPQLVPGLTYYIAITNPGPTVATYNLCVFDFPDFVPLADGICKRSELVHSNDAHYFVFNIASNSVRADFQTLYANGNVDLYLRQFPVPGPFPGEYDYASELTGTANEHIILTTNTATFPALAPGDWYLVVVNREPGPVQYCIQATQTGAPDISQIVCTNAVTIAAQSVQHFEYTISSNALRVLFQITNILGGNVDLYVQEYPPITGLASGRSTNPGTQDEFIGHSHAVYLNPPQTFRITVTNLDLVDVTYNLCVIETTNYTPLVEGVCYSNRLYSINVGDANYYSFDVASNAVQFELATTSATGNVDLYLRRVPHPGVPTGEYDYRSINGGVADELIVVRTNSTPVPLGPGRWYAAVVAFDLLNIDYCIVARQRVIEDITSVPCTNSLIAGNEMKYYQVAVPAGAFQVDFVTTNSSPGIDLYINTYPPLSLPGPGNSLAASATPATGDERITLSSSSVPQLQAPGTYLIGVSNSSVSEGNFTLCVTQVTNTFALTNGVCATNTLVALNDAHYYRVSIFSNSVRADFMTLSANGNVNLYVQRVIPPVPGPTSYDYRSENGGTADEIIVVTTSSSPVALAPGDWHLAVVNRDPSPVTYCVKVAQYPVLDPFNILLRITNGAPAYMDLGWNAFEFQRFYLEWTPTLSIYPTPWQPFTNADGSPREFGPVGGMGTNFYHRDQPLIDTNRFYRLNILP